MTRDEHLAWCKRRALWHVDRGELLEAVTSLGSDLSKHEGWKDSRTFDRRIYLGMMFEVPRGAAAVRRWIEDWH